MGARNVLFVLTGEDRRTALGQPSGFFLSEVSYPYRALSAAGFGVTFVSPAGGDVPVGALDLDDPVNRAFWRDERRRSLLRCTRRPDAVRGDDCAAIFFAGGHGALWDFPDNRALAALAARIHERGGVVGAICHGPAALLNVRRPDGAYLVAGRRVSAFTNEEERRIGLTGVVPFLLADRLVERGACHEAAPAFEARVSVSGRLVTGQNPASAPGVGEAMRELLTAGAA